MHRVLWLKDSKTGVGSHGRDRDEVWTRGPTLTKLFASTRSLRYPPRKELVRELSDENLDHSQRGHGNEDGWFRT